MISHRLAEAWRPRLRLPLIAAPMLAVSGPELVTAACLSGVIGAFPTVNARSIEELDAWLSTIEAALNGKAAAPYCPNLIIRGPRTIDDLACLLRHPVEMVITSVGSPAPVIGPLHDIGCKVFADVGSLEHAEKAVKAGADGLVLLTAGAGGQTGWLNPFAFVRAIRAWYDGPLVMAGGMSDGHALLAAQALGADLGYMGTKFIATSESLAKREYKDMLVESTMDDVLLTRAFTGMQANMLRPSIRAAGLDPEALGNAVSAATAKEMYGSGGAPEGKRRWTDIWSAGHSVSAVQAVPSVASLIADTLREYDLAKAEVASLGVDPR